jgi:uncharacterized membrane protein
VSEAPAIDESHRFQVRPVTVWHPREWLTRGAQDLRRNPWPGLLHGGAAAGFAGLLLWWGHDRFWLLSGAFSGFLLVAPLIATGLYEISRARERGESAGLRTALRVWWRRDLRLITFGLLLALAGTGWVLTSASMITVFAPAPVREPADFIRHIVLAPQGALFEAWLVLGGLLAAPMFASSVVAIPMLLDHRVTVLAAVLTSWRVVIANPAAMALWAGILLAVTLAGMAAGLFGLIPIVPWLAHASWHAYRDLVGPQGGRG